MKQQKWAAFVQSEVEGWRWQLTRKEQRRHCWIQGQVPHLLYKSSRGSHEGIEPQPEEESDVH